MRFSPRRGIALPRILIGVSWTAAAAAALPVVSALSGDFKNERDVKVPAVTARPVDSASAAPARRLDSTTALVLVYAKTCQACRANTDNWLKLVADMRAKHPGVPVIAIATPRVHPGTSGLPAALGAALTEYRLGSGDIDSTLGVDQVPATVVLRDGRVALTTFGLLGPRRAERVLEAFTGATQP